MTGSAITFMLIFWALIIGMSITTLRALLKHDAEKNG